MNQEFTFQLSADEAKRARIALIDWAPSLPTTKGYVAFAVPIVVPVVFAFIALLFLNASLLVTISVLMVVVSLAAVGTVVAFTRRFAYRVGPATAASAM